MRGHDTYFPLFPFAHFTKLAFIRRPIQLNEDHELLPLLIFYLLTCASQFALLLVNSFLTFPVVLHPIAYAMCSLLMCI